MPNERSLTANLIVRSSDPTGRLAKAHRVLYCNKGSDTAVLFCMEGSPKRPKRFSLSDITAEWEVGALVQSDISSPSFMLLSDEQIPQSYLSIRDKRWGRFEPLLGCPQVLLLYEDFSATVKQFADLHSIHLKTVYEGVYRFFFYGCMPNAFLPRFDLRGGPGKKRIFGTVKTGAPPKTVRLGHDESAIGVNVSDQTEPFQSKCERLDARKQPKLFLTAYYRRIRIRRRFFERPFHPELHLFEVLRNPASYDFLFEHRRYFHLENASIDRCVLRKQW